MLTSPDFKEKKIIIAYMNEGDKISFINDNIVIKDLNEKIKIQYTCYKLFILYIVGGITVTTGLIERSKKFGFSIVFLTSNFKLYETIEYKLEGNTILRSKQYATTRNLEIAKAIISNKIINQRYYMNIIRNKDSELKNTISLMDNYIVSINNLKTNYELMGVEGIASKIYFKQIFNNTKWNGRQPRVKRDVINLLLDIGYTILFNFIEAILNVYGFDIYKGNLHQEFYKRKSLVCDIIEPFRCIIDYKIRKMYNLGQINEEDFGCFQGRYQLDWKKSSKYMRCFIEEISNHKTDIFEYIQSYYRWVMKDRDILDFPFSNLSGGEKVDIIEL